MQTPLAVVCDLFLSLMYHIPNFDLPLTDVGPSFCFGNLMTKVASQLMSLISVKCSNKNYGEGNGNHRLQSQIKKI
jgi:hypothetical protein